MELGHLLTRSGLTCSEVPSKVYHDSFCQSDSSVSIPWVIYFEAFYLHVVSSFSCIPVICPKLVLFLTPLQFVHLFCNLSQVCPAVLLMYFVSAAVILLPSLALILPNVALRQRNHDMYSLHLQRYQMSNAVNLKTTYHGLRCRNTLQGCRFDPVL